MALVHRSQITVGWISNRLNKELGFFYQSQVSILGPVGYGPTTLPLRHSDLLIILPLYFI
ncbi:hypothetical protein AQUCO_01600212v1 [Aquilegia coerulea]|uniref:Uncharacterized protein n=1 Tax=Aquilegia coerulea TaxID=218851 RepID=A0A2G5DQV7_AQUCA|nr:hypothetical protein AQUCO_01600212v1 [Aquilegia coerulea]